MIESSNGIILRVRPLTETSLIVHWLTPDFGRIAMVARGARRPRSPFAGNLDLFYQSDFSFSRSRKSDLHILREVNPGQTRKELRQDMVKLRQAAYAVGFVEQTTETDTPLPAVFELISEFLDCLCRQKPTPANVFAIELKLLRELGLGPDLENVQLTTGTKQIVRTLTQKGLAMASRLKLADAQNAELRRFLHGFLIFHLGKLPKGRAAALGGDI